jgi:hypothetical protein
MSSGLELASPAETRVSSKALCSEIHGGGLLRLIAEFVMRISDVKFGCLCRVYRRDHEFCPCRLTDSTCAFSLVPCRLAPHKGAAPALVAPRHTREQDGAVDGGFLACVLAAVDVQGRIDFLNCHPRLEQGVDWIARIAASGLPSRRGGHMGA